MEQRPARPIGYRWASSLKAYDAAAEPRRCNDHYDAMAGMSATMLVRAEAVSDRQRSCSTAASRCQKRFESPTDTPRGRTRTVRGVFHVVVQYPIPVPSAQPAMTSVCQ